MTPLPGGAVADSATQQNLDALDGQTAGLNNRIVALERTVAGAINEGGTIAAGSGFTAEKTATGKYTITLSEELPTTGVMVVSPRNGGAAFAPTQGKQTFKVETMNPAETEHKDAAFTFVIQES